MLGLAAAVAVSVVGIVTLLPAGAPQAKDAAPKAEPVTVLSDGLVLWTLSPKEKDLVTELLWQQLSSNDGGIAYKLVWSLAKDPKAAIKLFNERIKPAELAIAKTEFDKWLENLDHPQFRAREAAEREMLKAGLKLPVGWIRDALSTAKSDEVRARLGRVLAQREKPDPTEWRLGRAVQILELAATDETKALLKAWAEAGGSTLSTDAKAALARMSRKLRRRQPHACISKR